MQLPEQKYPCGGGGAWETGRQEEENTFLEHLLCSSSWGVGVRVSVSACVRACVCVGVSPLGEQGTQSPEKDQAWVQGPGAIPREKGPEGKMGSGTWREKGGA